MSIWQFNYRLAQRLLLWNIVNAVVGLILLLVPGYRPYWRAVGSQALGWAAINACIAAVGRALTARRFGQQSHPYDADVTAREAQSLRRLLWVNTALMDPLYVLGGFWLAHTRGADNPRWRGMGHGIAVQGMLLLVFDLIHVLAVPAAKSR